ncbi:hypothetical protein WA026_003710 [Henosepilachna vigintioctopunctata]|uniref:Glucosidase 2 subunit beta n=1 Tax=Henosepilachna vigintioctopunctata TaxID=420089 RepID=A0AAW1UGF2_9CUCU
MDFLLRCVQLFLVCSLDSRIILKISSSEVPRPRGVSLSRASLYSPQNDFTCFDNSKTIPFSQVNDDYCDCPDASDEPGTSACPYGTFYCTNAGYEPLIISSDRVNDGICDCCDGSDEYSSSSTCANNCLELDKYAKIEAIEREKVLKAGKEIYADYSKKGIQEKQYKRTKLNELEKNKLEAESSLAEKERLKYEAETLENHAVEHWKLQHPQEEIRTVHQSEVLAAFVKYDANKDGKVSYGELQQDLTFDKDNDGKVSAEEALYFLNGHEEVEVEAFASEAWSLITPFLKTEYDENVEEKTDGDIDEISKEEEIVDNNEDNADQEEESKPVDTEQYEETQNLGYDEETQKLIDAASDARKEFSEAESNLRGIENEIKRINEYLNIDFGPNEEYAPLLGECFEFVDHEYIYKLCPFEKTVQQPKSGGHETSLGNWGKWSGPETNKYQKMLFEGGQPCWNGPTRSTLVNLSCGSENKVTSVFEPNRCEYVFTFTTPASCYDVINNDSEKRHDEL